MTDDLTNHMESQDIQYNTVVTTAGTSNSWIDV